MDAANDAQTVWVKVGWAFSLVVNVPYWSIVTLRYIVVPFGVIDRENTA